MQSLCAQQRITITRQTVPDTGFQHEVILGHESYYSQGIKQRTVTILVYKGNESTPRVSLPVTRYSTEKEFSGVPIGTVIAWAGEKAPATNGTWLECNGQSCTAYPELVAVLGKNTVPDYRGRFLESAEIAGTIKDAGLPNITGTIPARMSWQSSAHNGALSINSAFVSRGCDGGRIDGTLSRTLSINASLSNSIYGKSDTVQPASVTVRRFIKAA